MSDQRTIIEKIALLLGLPKTDIEIIVALEKKNHLLISEIAHEIKRTPRHVRQRVQFLTKKGFLNKEIEVLQNQRIAYRYSLIPLDKMKTRARADILGKLKEIETLVDSIKKFQE